MTSVKNNNVKGFGLIELMISILIASLVMGGLYSLLTSSVISYRVSKASNEAGASSRRVSNVFNSVLYQTGFINFSRQKEYTTWAASNNWKIYNGNTINWIENQIIDGYAINNSTVGDGFAIRFYGSSYADDLKSPKANTNIPAGAKSADADGYIFNCSGVPVPNTEIIQLDFYVGANGLVCHQVTEEVGGSQDAGENVVIDPSIVYMRVQYAAVKSGATTAFCDAKNIGSKSCPSSWADVNMIRYAMVTAQESSQKMVKATVGQELTLFEDSGEKYTVVSNNASSVHRVIDGTITLVNNL